MDMHIEYPTPYGGVFINHSAQTTGIRLSGGFDSAVMLFLLAKSINDSNSNSVIQPMTIRRSNPTDMPEYDRADSFFYSDQVVKYVKSKFPKVQILDTLKQNADYWWVPDFVNGQNRSSYLLTQNTLSSYVRWKNVQYYKRHNIVNYDALLYCEYVGTTMNPPVSEVPQSDESHRDIPKKNALFSSATVVYENHQYSTYEPFRNADKRITFWLADHFQILEDLLKITRTCEGGPEETHNFAIECDTCWWCLEKKWAVQNFERISIV
jgi:hypothetical protein